jgi:hypothetical protein
MLKFLNREDDSKWPQKNKDGRQELEIRLGNEHISFEVMCICGNLFFAVANTRRSGCADCENWVPCRCYRISGPRRAARVLLSSARPQGTRLLAHLPAFQGKLASVSIGDTNYNLF